MSYIDTFILVAEDCPIDQSEMPTSKRNKTPIHIIQYNLLKEKPYHFDHQTFIFEVYIIKNDLQEESEIEKQVIWDNLFSKGHPCLRASALAKRYGFGAHYNNEGKIAIYPVESKVYQTLINDGNVKKILAMRSKKK